MKTTLQKIGFFILISFFGAGCADSDFLDKTKLVNSLIKGEKVQTGSPLSKSVVLIAQQLEFKKDSVNIFGICSGAVIGARTVLTAAHCLGNGTDKMRVILDVNPRFQLQAKNIYQVVDAATHPDYKSLSEILDLEGKKQNADLAILYLDRDIETSEPTQFVKSTEIENRSSFLNLTLTGFGRTTAFKDTSQISLNELNGQLKKANLSIAAEILKPEYFEVDQRETSGICNGDSGSPVFINIKDKTYLFAMAVGTYRIHKSDEDSVEQSKYTDCAGSGVFVNLQNYTSWIFETMTKLSYRN